ncbi:MAG TPA: CBS domain-containing protein [Gemmatimonadales bacterium]|nr:CBS domain-containing protein [Gemmatimonadales bacterium]
MRVQDLLERKPSTLITIDVDGSVEQAVHLLMLHNIGGLPVVVNGGRLVGFVAERDIVRAVGRRSWNALDVRMREIMRPAATCQVDESLYDVMRRMTSERQRHLVVEEDGRPIGVISVGDIVKQVLEQLETEAGVLRDYVAAHRAGRG